MKELKPNHICKNPECKKEYYACNYCDKINSWRSACCSIECYEKYIDIVRKERSKQYPIRIDMTEPEVKNMVENISAEECLESSKDELSDYIELYPDMSIAQIVDKINGE